MTPLSAVMALGSFSDLGVERRIRSTCSLIPTRCSYARTVTSTVTFTRDGEMLIDEANSAASLRVVMTASKRAVPILKHPTWGVSAGRLSPDERWIAFHAIPDVSTRRVYVAPFRGADPIEVNEWIPITDDQGMERYANWSPDGNTLYFVSEHDGFRCIRAQRLNPVSKRPVGPPLDIQHFHHARRALISIPRPRRQRPWHRHRQSYLRSAGDHRQHLDHDAP